MRHQFGGNKRENVQCVERVYDKVITAEKCGEMVKTMRPCILKMYNR